MDWDYTESERWPYVWEWRISQVVLSHSLKQPIWDWFVQVPSSTVPIFPWHHTSSVLLASSSSMTRSTGLQSHPWLRSVIGDRPKLPQDQRWKRMGRGMSLYVMGGMSYWFRWSLHRLMYVSLEEWCGRLTLAIGCHEESRRCWCPQSRQRDHKPKSSKITVLACARRGMMKVIDLTGLRSVYLVKPRGVEVPNRW